MYLMVDRYWLNDIIGHLKKLANLSIKHVVTERYAAALQ